MFGPAASARRRGPCRTRRGCWRRSPGTSIRSNKGAPCVLGQAEHTALKASQEVPGCERVSARARGVGTSAGSPSGRSLEVRTTSGRGARTTACPRSYEHAPWRTMATQTIPRPRGTASRLGPSATAPRRRPRGRPRVVDKRHPWRQPGRPQPRRSGHRRPLGPRRAAEAGAEETADRGRRPGRAVSTASCRRRPAGMRSRGGAAAASAAPRRALGASAGRSPTSAAETGVRPRARCPYVGRPRLSARVEATAGSARGRAGVAVPRRRSPARSGPRVGRAGRRPACRPRIAATSAVCRRRGAAGEQPRLGCGQLSSPGSGRPSADPSLRTRRAARRRHAPGPIRQTTPERGERRAGEPGGRAAETAPTRTRREVRGRPGASSGWCSTPPSRCWSRPATATWNAFPSRAGPSSWSITSPTSTVRGGQVGARRRPGAPGAGQGLAVRGAGGRLGHAGDGSHLGRAAAPSTPGSRWPRPLRHSSAAR